MKALTLSRERVRDLVTDTIVDVNVAGCGACGGQGFLLYQVIGQPHYHIQCAACQTSFCPFDAHAAPTETNGE